MKLIDNAGVVGRTGINTEFGFKIQASRKAFDILSSGIYTDPILAIVRELSTNAYDAHVAAGNKDKPFDVSLPTYTNRSFKIRDYGTGLSDDDVRQIYSVYFCSNRTESNEFTGALGLGSKSPFSYVDNFLVTSFYNGRKTTFSLFKNEDGIPSVAELSASDTHSPNGVEIEVPIESYGDFHRFETAATQVYKHFNVLPNFLTTKITFVPEPTPVLSSNTFKLRRANNYELKSTLIMGQVGYKVNIAKLDLTFYNQLQNYELVIQAPTGTCSVAASREELHYDDQTKKYILDVIEEIKDIIKKEYEEFLKNSPTLLAKLRSASDYFAVAGARTNTYLGNISYSDSHKTKVLHVDNDAIKDRWNSSSTHAVLMQDTNTIIVRWHQDKFPPTHRISVAKHIQSLSPHSIVAVYCPDDAKFKELFGTADYCSKEVLEEIKKNRPKKVRTKTDYKSKIRLFDSYSFLKSDEIVKGRYYLRVYRYAVNLKQWQDPSDTNKPQYKECDLNYFKNIVREIYPSIDLTQVYLVMNSRAELDAKRYGLKSLDEVLIKKAEAIVNKYSHMFGDRDDDIHASVEAILVKNHVKNGSVLDRLIDVQNLPNDKPQRYLNSMVVMLGLPIPKYENPYKEILKKYPLLKYIYNMDDRNQEAVESVMDYIKLKENT